MKLFTLRTKMADVVHANYLVLPVLGRFGIELGFGERTVQEICREGGIDAGFFLVIVNAFSNERYAPEKQLRTSDVLQLVDYLEKTHAYYVETQLPLIERLLEELHRQRPQDGKNMTLIRRFFQEYKSELLSHLAREGTTTFPYVRQVCRMSSRQDLTARERRSLSQYSMRVYAAEHNNVDEKLYDLKNILIKYVRSGVAGSASQDIVFELFRLEKDIQDHTRIEDTVLRPLVQELEGRLIRPGDRKERAARTSAGASVRPSDEASEQQGLSDREVDVLRLVARGYLNKQIAGRLGISLHTVISHRKNITRKLGIRTVAGLTVYSLMNHFITPKDVR